MSRKNCCNTVLPEQVGAQNRKLQRSCRWRAALTASRQPARRPHNHSGASALAAQCPVYKARQDRFHVAWHTGKATGEAVLRLVLRYPGASEQVETGTVSISK